MPALGFLDLPREIRDHIYAKCLTAQRNLVKGRDFEPDLIMPNLIMIDHQMQVQIVRLSRQIYTEARATMIQWNSVIEVHIQSRDLRQLLPTLGVPVLYWEDWNPEVKPKDKPSDVVRLKLTVAAASHSYASDHFLILEEDHETVVKLIADMLFETSHTGMAQPLVKIELLQENGASLQQVEKGLKTQSIAMRLLAPYGKHLRGCDRHHVSCSGAPKSTGISEAIVNDLCRPYSNWQLHLMAYRRSRNADLCNPTGDLTDGSLRRTCNDLRDLARRAREHQGGQDSGPERGLILSNGVGAADIFDKVTYFREVTNDLQEVLLHRVLAASCIVAPLQASIVPTSAPSFCVLNEMLCENQRNLAISAVEEMLDVNLHVFHPRGRATHPLNAEKDSLWEPTPTTLEHIVEKVISAAAITGDLYIKIPAQFNETNQKYYAEAQFRLISEQATKLRLRAALLLVQTNERSQRGIVELTAEDATYHQGFRISCPRAKATRASDIIINANGFRTRTDPKHGLRRK